MCLNSDHVFLKKSDEYTEVVFAPAKLKTWFAKITDIRLDNMKNSSFEIESIELMKYVPENSKYKNVSVNGSELTFEFLPFYENGSLIASIDPQFLFFRKTKLYHEYFPNTNKLLVASVDKEVVFEIGSDKATLCGKPITLSRPVTMRDGIPTFALGEFCDLFGIKYKDSGEMFEIEV